MFSLVFLGSYVFMRVLPLVPDISLHKYVGFVSRFSLTSQLIIFTVVFATLLVFCQFV